MALNYVTKDNLGANIELAIRQGLLTGVLGNGNEAVNFIGGKYVTLRTIATSGLQDYDRQGGYPAGSYEDAKTTLAMGMDRGIKFPVDAQDVDETNQEVSIANISKEFLLDQVQPEIDSYRFQQLAGFAQNASNYIDGTYNSTETLDKTTIYPALKEAIKPIRRYGTQNIVIFISSDMMDALEQSTSFTRNIVNQTVDQTALEARITSIDGVQIVEVWDSDRFHDKFDFSNGVSVAAGAHPINFLAVVSPAVIPIVKENSIKLITPDENQTADGWIYANRLYHDIFVHPSMAGGFGVSLGSVANTTAYASATNVDRFATFNSLASSAASEAASSSASSSSSSASSSASSSSSSASA